MVLVAAEGNLVLMELMADFRSNMVDKSAVVEEGGIPAVVEEGGNSGGGNSMAEGNCPDGGPRGGEMVVSWRSLFWVFVWFWFFLETWIVDFLQLLVVGKEEEVAPPVVGTVVVVEEEVGTQWQKGIPVKKAKVTFSSKAITCLENIACFSSFNILPSLQTGFPTDVRFLLLSATLKSNCG
ncbi:unnamed protein product [Fraxinus pennsylvanica]|uniref:Uncharacterized protein n=1 Tax=Fraxinus pennsylvanica TaxID=56036 RepID=A0AAD1YSY6_9LAMI|nr:unnamed protein product [Fraxinus pennsylvanica]